MPLVPPVTRAILSASLFMTFSWVVVGVSMDSTLD
jgi:hypothetical protein